MHKDEDFSMLVKKAKEKKSEQKKIEVSFATNEALFSNNHLGCDA